MEDYYLLSVVFFTADQESIVVTKDVAQRVIEEWLESKEESFEEKDNAIDISGFRDDFLKSPMRLAFVAQAVRSLSYIPYGQ